MDEDYRHITAELDAREILRYLNNLGIHNISGEVLKHFITDLKRLIKYDLEQKKENCEHRKFEYDWPERLHSASTFSSRIRSKGSEGAILTCGKECAKNRHTLKIRNTHSAPNIGAQKVQIDGKLLRRACSCVRVERKPETSTKDSRVTSSQNLIKVAILPVKKKCDPVLLYHYYTALWAKYKSNVPGENNWADLRWNVRQKMASTAQPAVNKGPEKSRHKTEASEKK